MGQVTAIYAQRVAGTLDPSVDRKVLLAPLGLDPAIPADPSHMVPAHDYYEFLERAARADPLGITLPLRSGNAMRCNDYGVFGFAFKAATTVRGSYIRAERYGRVLTSVTSFSLERTNDGAFIHMHRSGERRLGMRLSNEATVASLRTISQEVASEPFSVEAVHFMHPAPSTTEHHEAFFGCPVVFNSDRDALLVSERNLRICNKVGDVAMAHFFDSHLEEEIEKLADAVPLDKQVRDHIKAALSEGIPTLSEIADELGMSGRSLQRHLSDHGHSFQGLVTESRQQLAKHLVGRTGYPFIEIAFLTGFSDQSAFNRAFKRWVGKTPRQYRLETAHP